MTSEAGFSIFPAPPAGYSEPACRTIRRSCSEPYAATETLLDRFLVTGLKLRRSGLVKDTTNRAVAAQLIGAEPAAMAEAAVTAVRTDADRTRIMVDSFGA